MATLSMKNLVPALILIWLTSFMNFALGDTSNSTNSYQSWDDVPICAKNCIIGTLTIPNQACDPGDYTCLCTGFQVEANIGPCLDATCGADVAAAAGSYFGNTFCYAIPAEALASASAVASERALTASTYIPPSTSSTLTETLMTTIGTITATSIVPATTLSHSTGTLGDPTFSLTSRSTSIASPTDPRATTSPSTTLTDLISAPSTAASASYQTDTGDPMATTTTSTTPAAARTSSTPTPDQPHSWVIVIAILGTLLVTFSSLWAYQFFLRWRRRRRMIAEGAAAAEATEDPDPGHASSGAAGGIPTERVMNTGTRNDPITADTTMGSRERTLSWNEGDDIADGKNAVSTTVGSTQSPGKYETMTKMKASMASWRTTYDDRFVDNTYASPSMLKKMGVGEGGMA